MSNRQYAHSNAMMTVSTPISLQGRKALVTGSSHGIGSWLVEGLAQAGADVAVHGVASNEVLFATCERCANYAVHAVTVTGDLAESGRPAAIVDEVVGKLGGLDILILNASIQYRQWWDEWDADAARKMCAVNLEATAEMIAAAVPGMKAAGWGRVITLGSVQQYVPNPHTPFYAATKHAQLGYIRAIAGELAGSSVTLNNIALGVFETDRNRDALSDPVYRQKIQHTIPAGRFGNTDDCTGAALWLCSDAGGYVTGNDIVVDGGMSLGNPPKQEKPHD